MALSPDIALSRVEAFSSRAEQTGQYAIKATDDAVSAESGSLGRIARNLRDKAIMLAAVAALSVAALGGASTSASAGMLDGMSTGNVLGGVLGAAAGGLTGSAIGRGAGNQAAVAVGTIGGAVLGSQVGGWVEGTQQQPQRVGYPQQYPQQGGVYNDPYGIPVPGGVYRTQQPQYQTPPISPYPNSYPQTSQAPAPQQTVIVNVNGQNDDVSVDRGSGPSRVSAPTKSKTQGKVSSAPATQGASGIAQSLADPKTDAAKEAKFLQRVLGSMDRETAPELANSIQGAVSALAMLPEAKWTPANIDKVIALEAQAAASPAVAPSVKADLETHVKDLGVKREQVAAKSLSAAQTQKGSFSLD